MIKELGGEELHSIPLVVFDRISSVDVENGLIDLPWDRLRETLFSSHQTRKNKDGYNFWPVELKPREDWVLTEKKLDDGGKSTYRTKDNVSSVSMVIMDLDQPGSIDLVDEYLSDIEHVLYSTHSFNEKTPYKYRLVMPLEKAIASENWESLFHKIRPLVNGDSSCCNLSRHYYLPTHDPESKIPPVIRHNQGVFLNEEIAEAIFNKAAKVSPNIRPAYHKKNAKTDLNIQSKSLNYTYEGLCDRHSKLINGLRQSDSRHDFALRVIHSEVSRNKDQINIPATIKFIFRAAQEFSSKPLHRGNTISEIPEMLSSSIQKEAPGVISGFKSASDYSSIIEKWLNEALSESMTGQWSFPKYTPPQTKCDRLNPYTRQAFADRHLPDIKEMMREDGTCFLSKIISKEAERDVIDYTTTIKYLSTALTKRGSPDPFGLIENTIKNIDISQRTKEKFITAVRIHQFKVENRPPDSGMSP